MLSAMSHVNLETALVNASYRHLNTIDSINDKEVASIHHQPPTSRGSPGLTAAGDSIVEFTVEVTLRATRPLTQTALMRVAELGGITVGKPGDRHLETTLTVTAANVCEAAKQGAAAVSERISGEIVAVEAMTTDEADRRANERPELVGVGEIAEMFGLSKQRVSTLSKREDFPRPLAQLSSGPIWRAGDLSTFAAGWKRKPGRPRNIVGATAM
jgi:hypothetical protein